MEVKKLYIDFETRSRVDLRTTGTYKYAQDPSTEVILVSYACDAGPVQTREVVTPELRALIANSKVCKIAHNAEFDMCVARYVLGIETSSDGWHDTAYQAAYFGYPRALRSLADYLRVVTKAASDEMRFFSRPDKNGGFPSAEMYPELWARFRAYSARDVEALRAVYNKMAALPRFEQQVMRLTFEMNANGVPFDMTFGVSVLSYANKFKANAQYEALQKYGVHNLTSASQVKAAMQRLGQPVDTLSKKERVESSKLLSLRDVATCTSFSKIDKVRARITQDARLHGEFVGFGAHTGRWSSRGVQLQNLARGGDTSTDLTKVRDINHLKAHIRLCVYAPNPYNFVCADLSQIEARVTAWLAGCQWRMDAFARGEDIYARSAERMLGIKHVDKSMPERQIGKCAELGLGYGGGANAIKRIAPDFYNAQGEERVREIVQLWRAANPEIVRLWRKVEEYFTAAVKYGRTTLLTGAGVKLTFIYDGRDVAVVLPSGRCLYYRGLYREASALFYIDYTNGQGVHKKLWGGILVENIVQAIARDVLVDIMLRTRRACTTWQLIGTVHDEVWYLVPADETDALSGLLGYMCAPISWAKGLCVTGDGFLAKRYIK